MESLYTVYYNEGNDVTPLASVTGYTDADTNFEEIAKKFLKRFFTEKTPFIIRKYEEMVVLKPKIKADISFPQGIVFAKKMHDACIYEKICYEGTVYNSYEVKYIGRIGVMCEQRPVEYHKNSYIQTLKDQVDQKDRLIHQQELLIKRFEAEVKRLERSLERSLQSAKTDSSLTILDEIPVAPVPPTPNSTPKVNKYIRQGQVSGDVLEELRTLFNDKLRLEAEKEREEERQKQKEEDERVFRELISEIDFLTKEL